MVFAFPSGLNPEVFPLAWLVGEWEGTGQISYHEQVPTARAWNHIKFSHDGGPYLKYESVIRIIGEGEHELPGAVLPSEGMDSPEVQALVEKYSQVHDAADPNAPEATAPNATVGRGEPQARLETTGGQDVADQASGAPQHSAQPFEPALPVGADGKETRPETSGEPAVTGEPTNAPDVDPRTGQIWSSETGFWKVSPLRHGSMAGNEFALEVFIVDADGRMTFFNGEASPARVILASAKTVRSALASEVDGSKRMFGYVNDHLAWAEDMVAFGHELGSYASFFLERTVDGDGNPVAPE